jgi:hypothetical protein
VHPLKPATRETMHYSIAALLRPLTLYIAYLWVATSCYYRGVHTVWLWLQNKALTCIRALAIPLTIETRLSRQMPSGLGDMNHITLHVARGLGDMAHITLFLVWGNTTRWDICIISPPLVQRYCKVKRPWGYNMYFTVYE